MLVYDPAMKMNKLVVIKDKRDRDYILKTYGKAKNSMTV